MLSGIVNAPAKPLSEKAPFSMNLRDDGKLIWVNEVVPRNAQLPIFVMLLVNVTPVIFSFCKALSPISVTVQLMWYFVSVTFEEMVIVVSFRAPL